jgi:hypothetical protein
VRDPAYLTRSPRDGLPTFSATAKPQKGRTELVTLENSRKLEIKTHLGWFYGRLAKASVLKAIRNEVNFCQE